MDDTNLKIYDAELVETNKINEPGTIIETTKKAIIVATNDNEAVAIKDMQLAREKENVSCQLFKWCAKHTSREETYMIENVRSLAFDTIQDILNEGAYSNLRINEVLSENELNAMDKALFTEIVYGTVKRKYTLDFYLKPFVKTKIKAWVRQLLWMSIYQYVYFDKVPNHAIINEAVEIAKERGGYHNGNVVNGILVIIVVTYLILMKLQILKKRMAIEYSMPKWIIDHWATHYGLEETETILQSFLETTSTTVRANLTRASLDDIIEKLQDEGYDVEKDHDLPYCLHIGGQPIIHSRSFKDGFVSIQDKSSMFVAHIMNVDRHDHVLDSQCTWR